MELTVWTYEGPPHIGAMRIATAMSGLHYVLHAPQGDTYADLLFTMIERRSKRPPVSYTTFQARDLGGDTAELFKTAARNAYDRFQPQAMIVGSSCTAELIQDDPGGLAAALSTADGLLLTIANALSHDLYYKMIDPNAPTARRVMISKILLLVVAILAALVLVWRAGRLPALRALLLARRPKDKR